MRFDPAKHVLTDEFATLLGVAPSSIGGKLAHPGCPRAIGRVTANSRRQAFYDRREVASWLQLIGVKKGMGEIVPPRTPQIFRPLNLSDGLRANFRRASEVYPHRFSSLAPSAAREYA